MDEEALKRNTDCVYFLASPLTCKKGHGCEYRHNESARINPRDCWFWPGGNCLNRRCPFRHPPLETHPAAQVPVLETSNKSRVPCYFFLQGFCAKGDKCAFTHGSLLGGNPGSSASQKQTKASITGTEPQAVEKKASNISNNGSVENFSHLPSTPMEVEFPNDTKPVDQAGNQPSHAHTGQYITDAALPDIESTRVRMLDVPNNLLNKFNESHVYKVQPTEGIIGNDEETEWWEESSPGFDVLVDDGPEPVGYQEDAGYLSEPDMESERCPSRTRGRTMHTTEEFVHFDYDNPSAYGHPGYFDEQSPYDFGPYDAYEHAHVSKQESTELNDRRDGRVLHCQRRGLSIERDTRQGKNGDLYHRLAKRKRIDKGQIVGNSLGRLHTDTLLWDFHHGRRQQGNRHRYLDAVLGQKLSHQAVRHSSRRLHGRIFSGNCDVSRDLYQEGRDDIKENPEKAQVHLRHFSNHLSGRFRAAAPMQSRDFKTKNVNKNKTIKDDTDFAGPKTLAQIREEKRRSCLRENGLGFHESNKEPRNSVQVATLKSRVQPTYNLYGQERRMSMGKVIQAPSKLTDFEGPKTLSAILKAKRKAGSGTDSGLQIMLAEGPSQFALKPESGENIDTSWVVRKKDVQSSASKKEDEAEIPQGGSNASEASNHCQRRVDVKSTNGATNSWEGNFSSQENGAPLIREDDRVQDMITNGSNNINVDEDVDHIMFHESEEDKKAGEQVLEQEDADEFLEDDDEDDFAKRLGVLFT